MLWELCVHMEVMLCIPHSGVFIIPIVGLCLNRFTSCCALTLSHFSAYNRQSFGFPFLPLFYTGLSMSSHFIGVHRLSPLSLQKIILIFVLKRQRVPLLKVVMTSASPAARPAIGEPAAQTCSSLPDQPTDPNFVK